MPIVIKDYDSGLLTNGEVHKLLLERRSKRVYRKDKHNPEYVQRNWMDEKVIQYTKDSELDTSVLSSLVSMLVNSYGITSKKEILQIVNLQPSEPVDIHLIIADCDMRFTESQVDDLLNDIATYSR